MKKALFFGIMVLIISYSHSQTTSKQFTLLNSDQTNIDFNNLVKDQKKHNILIYSNYYGGAGVGLGDFNNDGLQDVYFAGNLVSDKLYMNLGGLKFEDITDTANIKDNGGWSSGVVVGDINNDGWLDIYVTRELYDDNAELRRNKLYINTTKENPDGKITFQESSKAFGLDNSERTRHAVFLDYDKDGFLDIFLLNQPPNPGNFSEMYGTNLKQNKFSPRLFKNNGNGTFIDMTSKAGLLKPGYANSVSVFDADNDGWQDIYVTNDFDAPDFFYKNNGDGTFTNIADEALKHISYFSMGSDAADVNNDGKLDLMVVDMVAEDNYRIKSNMSGMNPKSFWNIVDQGGHYQYMFNSLQLNHGNNDGMPQFGDVAQMAGMSSTDWSWSNLIADFDNDGFKDVHVTNGLLRDIRNTDSDKEVSKYITKVANDYVKNNPTGGTVTIWDILDLDKALGIIPSVKLKNYAYKNVDGIKFEKVTDDWGFEKHSFSAGSAYGDLDNDGDLDLVVNNVNDMAFVYENNSDKLNQHNYLRIELTDKNEHKPLVGARIKVVQGTSEQLYEYTSVRGMYSTSEAFAHFGLSNTNVVDKVEIIWPDGLVTALNNVKANQLLQIDINDAKGQKAEKNTIKAIFNQQEIIAFNHIENKYDDFREQVLLPHKQSQFGPGLATGDVNGDGLEDVFIGGATGHLSGLFIQKENGAFERSNDENWKNEKSFEDIDAAFFDVDNDNDLDLYVVSGGNVWEANSDNYQDRLYLNDGQGNFTFDAKALPKMTESGSCVRPFDFDKDGDLDLFIGGRHKPHDYPAPVSSRILENENGSFKDITKSMSKEFIDIGMVTDAVWVDFDEDGLSDLVIAGEWMPITFFKNSGKGFENVTQNMGLKNTEGWWYSIEKGDMDNDGDDDLIVGNLGLNYKYKATAAEPFEVHYDDFDANGHKDIVLSYYNFGEQFPLRGRSCSSQQIPDIKKEFKSYNIFASASLTDVYGSNNLEAALHYQSKTYASMYLENEDDGTFKMTALPNEAQITNIDDILVDDVNNDGFKDVIIAGNMHPVEIETTRNDAGVGLLLLGNGKGDFVPVSSEESGLFLSGDVQKMSIINTKGKRLLIAAMNNEKMKSFQWNR